MQLASKSNSKDNPEQNTNCLEHCRQTYSQGFPPQPHHSRVKVSSLATDSIQDSVYNIKPYNVNPLYTSGT